MSAENNPSESPFRVFRNEQDKVAAIHNYHVAFGSRFVDFFLPSNEDDVKKEGSRVLAAHDYVGTRPGRLAHYYKGKTVLIPQKEVEDGYIKVVGTLRDPNMNPIKHAEEDIGPDIQDFACPRLESFKGQMLYLVRLHFVLTPVDNVLREVQQVKILTERGGEELGEVWIGDKRQPGANKVAPEAKKTSTLVA